MMQMKTALLFLATATVMLFGISAYSHHGFAIYSSERITVQATIKEFRFINPHVQLYFDVLNQTNELEAWQGELTAPNKLARAGWTKNSFRPGDVVKISGERAKNGGHSIRIREIITADGISLPVTDRVDF